MAVRFPAESWRAASSTGIVHAAVRDVPAAPDSSCDVMAKLLVVDDDMDMAECCADVLCAEGHRVRIARDGAEGLALVAAELPDLILLDVEMPVLNGPDMAYRMFLNDVGQEQIPLLLSSGVLDLRGVAEQIGTPYYLGKPFSVEQLLSMVARALVERTAPTPRSREGLDGTQRGDRS